MQSNLPFSYSIRRSQRATRVRIIVSAGNKVEVVAPVNVPEHRIHQFIHTKQQWIILSMDKVAAKTRQTELPSPIIYSDGTDIPYRGNVYKLVIRPSKLKKIKIEFADVFIAHVPEALLGVASSEYIKTALTAWMKKQARLHVEQLVKQHAVKNQLFPRRLAIKTQKSRWGSCGINNDININWLLIMAPIEVLEYVVVHELCHIQIRNHSVHFWALVAQHLPEFQKQRRWLKEHGSHLMRGLN